MAVKLKPHKPGDALNESEQEQSNGLFYGKRHTVFMECAFILRTNHGYKLGFLFLLILIFQLQLQVGQGYLQSLDFLLQDFLLQWVVILFSGLFVQSSGHPGYLHLRFER